MDCSALEFEIGILFIYSLGSFGCWALEVNLIAAACSTPGP